MDWPRKTLRPLALIMVVLILQPACGTLASIAEEGTIKPFGGMEHHSKKSKSRRGTDYGPIIGCINSIGSIDIVLSFAADVALLPVAITLLAAGGVWEASTGAATTDEDANVYGDDFHSLFGSWPENSHFRLDGLLIGEPRNMNAHVRILRPDRSGRIRALVIYEPKPPDGKYVVGWLIHGIDATRKTSRVELVEIEGTQTSLADSRDLLFNTKEHKCWLHAGWSYYLRCLPIESPVPLTESIEPVKLVFHIYTPESLD